MAYTLKQDAANPFWTMRLPAGEYVIVEQRFENNDFRNSRIKVVLMGPDHPTHPARYGVWMDGDTFRRVFEKVGG
jgi:hypothetical protein